MRYELFLTPCFHFILHLYFQRLRSLWWFLACKALSLTVWWSLVFCQGDWRQDLTTFICLTSLSWPDQLFGLNQVFLTDLFTQTSDTKWDAWCHSTSQSKWKNEIGGKSTKSQHVWKLWGGKKSYYTLSFFRGRNNFWSKITPNDTGNSVL